MRRSVESVAPSGSLVAAGAGWGLGDDPALRTWSHLGSKVPVPAAPLSFFSLPPAETFMSHFPLSQGGDTRAARGKWDGVGCVGAALASWGRWRICTPQQVVHGQVLANLTLNVRALSWLLSSLP